MLRARFELQVVARVRGSRRRGIGSSEKLRIVPNVHQARLVEAKVSLAGGEEVGEGRSIWLALRELEGWWSG